MTGAWVEGAHALVIAFPCHRLSPRIVSAKLNDQVRLTAIAGAYSALIDKRAYKGSMASEAALDMVAQSKGASRPGLDAVVPQLRARSGVIYSCGGSKRTRNVRAI